MIPELPTEGNIKPVLEMMMPTIVYVSCGGNSTRFGRSKGFVWLDDVYAEQFTVTTE